VRMTMTSSAITLYGQCQSNAPLLISSHLTFYFLPERDYATFGFLLSQFRLSSVCLSSVFEWQHCREAWVTPNHHKPPHFYPNVTTLRSGLCYHNSVCRLSVCLSVSRLSVTLVHPTQGVEAFGKISSPLCTLAIL